MRATRFAATLGRAFSYVLIGLGFFSSCSAAVVAAASGGLPRDVPGPAAARARSPRRPSPERIGGVTVADIMDREPVAIPDGDTVAQAHDEYFLRYRWPWFPVVDGDGRFVGTVRQQPAEDAASRRGRRTRSASVMDRRRRRLADRR